MAQGRLTRQLTRTDGLAIAIGSVIGTGIFRTTGPVLTGAGGPLGATIVWVLAGFASLAGAFLYADLSSRVPEAGGPYAYVREAFGRRVAFVDGWLDAAVVKPTSQAAAVAVVGEIVSQGTGLPWPRTFAALAFALLLVLTLSGVRTGALAQRVFTTTKLVTIAFVIGLAVLRPVRGDAPPAPPSLDLATALAGAWFTYLGWQDAAMLAEELERPERDMRAVLVGTVGTVMVAYTAFHGAMLLGLGDSALARSDLPALHLARAILGEGGEVLVSAALVSAMLGAVAEGLLVRPRVAFALARDGLAPAALTAVGRGGTPHTATLAHASIVLTLVLSGGFEWLLPPLVFAQAAAMLLESSSYFVLRRRGASRHAVPPVVAAAFVAVNAVLLVHVTLAHPGPCLTVLLATLVLFLLYPLVARAQPTAAERQR